MKYLTYPRKDLFFNIFCNIFILMSYLDSLLPQRCNLIQYIVGYMHLFQWDLKLTAAK